MNIFNTFPYGLKYGLISATISLAVMFGLYAANPEMIFSAWYINSIGMLALVVLMVMAALEFRKDNNGNAAFGEAFSCAFFTFAISVFMSTLGQYVLINVIDPSLLVLQKQIAIEAMAKILETFGATEDTIEKAIEEIEKNGGQSFAQMITGYFVNLLMGALIALIIAAITKKKRTWDYSDALRK